MTIEIILITAGVVSATLITWASLWYKLGKLTTEVRQCKEESKEVRKSVEHILTRQCDTYKEGE